MFGFVFIILHMNPLYHAKYITPQRLAVYKSIVTLTTFNILDVTDIAHHIPTPISHPV